MTRGRKLTLALPKGRLFQPAWDLLRRMRCVQAEGWGDERGLVREAAGGRLRIVRIRDVDVPTYVEHGAADLGVVGKDILLEQEKVVYEPLDLGFGLCRLVLAAPADSGDRPRWEALAQRAHLRVATKFVRITERFFGAEAVPVDVVRLSGAVELAPALGLADAIVDLVDTGGTLRENGLAEVREILRSSARLIVNRASQKTRREEVSEFVRLCQRRLAP
ncbi:MAG: ATP phosphoribosyltransferase [Candidatus Tectomicrobia bacterium]|nr:ATP phosphoribosyltransferase [Candidatus Tectomicrobia bacterium]